MSPKSTRSSNPKPEITDSSSKVTKAPAIFKVFYISEALLNDATNELCLERFFHPGRNAQALFITHDSKEIMEIMEFSEPRRSWLINSNVCSNGRIYATTPIDATFLALHHIRKHCSNKALELETIYDEKDASVSRLLKKFVSTDSLRCIADVKTAGEMIFFKYNHEKTLAWLALKTKRLAHKLKDSNIHCGRSALSQNYKRSEKVTEETINEIDYLRFACEIIGGYLDLDLSEKLTQHLKIPKEVHKAVDENDESKKRKSLTTLKSENNKKIKSEYENVDENEDNNVAENATNKLKNSSLLDGSIDDVDDGNTEIDNINTSPIVRKTEPLKERVMTAKEKALAKSAKGTKSIASFFKK